MTDALVPWVLLVLALATGGVVVVLIRRRNAAAIALTRAQHETDLTDRAALHEGALAQLDIEHQRELAEHEVRLRDAEALNERLHDRATRQLRFELPSKAALLEACSSLDLDGVLATNIVFPVVDRGAVTIAQIDHVLVTDSAAIVFESKYWQGVVFDGVRPSEVHESFSRLIDEADLGTSFAIQLVVDQNRGLCERRYLDRDSPRAQVRRQAQRLHDHLAAELGEAPFLTPYVYYSYGTALVYTGRGVAGRPSEGTEVIASRASLDAVLRRTKAHRRAPGSPSLVETIVPALDRLGADLRGTGAHESRGEPLVL